MPVHFNAAPLSRQLALFVNNESRPVDAHILFAEIFLHLQHIVLSAQLLLGVGQKREIEILLGNKLFMRLQIVAADSQHNSILLFKTLKMVPEILGFLRSAGGHIFRIKVKNHNFAPIVR